MKLLSIGEFAKRVDLSVAAVRYMQKTGTLEPAYVSKGGTRYYSVDQVDEYNSRADRFEFYGSKYNDKATNDKLRENYAKLFRRLPYNITREEEGFDYYEGLDSVLTFIDNTAELPYKIGRVEDFIFFEKRDSFSDFKAILDDMHTNHRLFGFRDHVRVLWSGHECVAVMISPYIDCIDGNASERQAIVMGYLNKLIMCACPDMMKEFDIIYLNEDETIHCIGGTCTIVFVRKPACESVRKGRRGTIDRINSFVSDNLTHDMSNDHVFDDTGRLRNYLFILDHIYEEACDIIVDTGIDDIIECLDDVSNVTQLDIDGIWSKSCKVKLNDVWNKLKIYADMLSYLVYKDYADMRVVAERESIVRAFACLEKELRNLSRYLQRKNRINESYFSLFVNARRGYWRKLKFLIDFEYEYRDKLRDLSKKVKLPARFSKFLFDD